MLPMPQNGDNLKRVLREVNYLYHVETRAGPKADAEEAVRESEKRLPGATNTEQPEETQHDS